MFVLTLIKYSRKTWYISDLYAVREIDILEYILSKYIDWHMDYLHVFKGVEIIS